MSIVQAFDAARIRGDAEADQAKTLGGYLEELLSESERRERDAERFFARLDRQIAAGEMTEQ